MGDSTKTIRSSGGHYTSVSGWESGEQRNLTTLGERAIGECYNDWTGNGLSNGATIAGWTTDSGDYVILRNASGEGHDGVPGAGFRMYINGTGNTLKVEQDYTRIEGIECRNIDDGNGFNHAFYVDNEDIIVDGCIGSASYICFLIENTSSTQNAYIRNCMARPAGPVKTPTAFDTDDLGNGTSYIDNCVAGGAQSGWNCNIGFKNNVDTIIRNCVAYNCTTSYSGSVKTGSKNNAADDASTNTPPGTSPFTTDIVSGDFTDAANDDYTLASGSNLIGEGADLSGDFTTDVNGSTRPTGSAWDIGFDHFESASDDLLADNVESASEVSSPAIGQTHALAASDVESASEVTAPTLAEATGDHNLLADNVESASEVSSPTIGQTHVLLADNVESASEVSAPAINGTVALLAENVESASEVTAPGLTSSAVNMADLYVKLCDIWKILGLDENNPMTVTPTSRVAGDVNQTISGDGVTSTTVTRNP